MSRDSAEEPFLRPHPLPSLPASKTKARLIYIASTAACLLALWAIFFPTPSEPTHHHTLALSNDTVLPVYSGQKWTLPLPALPLNPSAMARTCAAVPHSHADYYHVDSNFIDPTTPLQLTYSLATPDGSAYGLAESLLELFTAYALARHENRIFAISDHDWPWGGWADYFLPITTHPSPSSSSSLPCPRSVNHLSVAHSTRTHIFGHAFTEHFENARKSGSHRQQRIFTLLHTGQSALFRLTPPLEAAATARIASLTATLGAGPWVAIHLRRPKTWRWNTSHIPVVEPYVEAAASLGSGGSGAVRVVVLSDHPEIAAAAAPLLAGSVPALGPKQGLLLPGGFDPRGFLELPIEERVQIGKRFLVELRVAAVLAARGREGGVVCAAGSATCRLLAVMVGWEKSVESNRWRDVDGGLGWNGVDW